MQSKEFKDLVENREQWVQVNIKNRFNFDDILAGPYNDPSHFVYEILQNADDADPGATEVTFKLYKDRLDIYHDGGDFDFKDIDGVTGIGIRNKEDDITKIGKFGVGFKSIFAITRTPEIHSGSYHIRIQNFVVPTAIQNNSAITGTKITLPFNHKLRSKEEVFNLISAKLENIGLKTLLFVKNIKGIKWESPSKNGQYYKKVDEIKKSCLAKRVSLVSAKGGKDSVEEYIVIEKKIGIEKKNLKVEVAYRIRRDEECKERIIPEPDSKLVVYFPTERVTFLNFLIQGPYKTTPNRENIPLGDEQNKQIVEETGNLIADSLTTIKKLGLLDINFLKTLPISEKHTEDEIYSVVYQKVKAKLRSDEELLPTFEGNYARASDVLLARGKDLPEILKQADVECLFSKRHWLDTNITYDKTRELRDYLVGVLEIQEIDFEAFARKITSDFLSSKSDEWMIEFYKRLLDQPALWRESKYRESAGVLRFKPIIRLENNEHIEPFDSNGKIQVYLPTDTKSAYKTVKADLLRDEDSQKFLKEIGLEKPDLFSEVIEFILPKYKDPIFKGEEYFDDFNKLLEAYNSISPDKKVKLIIELKTLSFVHATNVSTNEIGFKKPSEVYSPEPDLKEYFHKCGTVYFVSSELCEKFDKELLFAFLKEAGVEDKPRRIEFFPELSINEKRTLRGENGYTRDISQKDYKYHGLDEFINDMTIEKSCLLWKLLLKTVELLSTWDAKEFFKGKYTWMYHREYPADFKAKFLKTLKEASWLVDKDGNFRRPYELTPSKLSTEYNQEGANRDILIRELGFQSDIIDQLSDEDKNFLKLKRTGLTPEEIMTLIEDSKKKKGTAPESEEEAWNPLALPGDVKIGEDTTPLEGIETEDLSGQKPRKVINDENDSGTEENEKDKPDKSPPKSNNSKEIGNWGEQLAKRYLERKYSDSSVVWLNSGGNVGKGYDFIIQRDGSDIAYYEVKSKVDEVPTLFEISGTQWNWARKLHTDGEGDKYIILLVSNAGNDKAKIREFKNPVALWKVGKIQADPVNIQL
jgi:hypothetical protein